jgi:hypothetical protein
VLDLLNSTSLRTSRLGASRLIKQATLIVVAILIIFERQLIVTGDFCQLPPVPDLLDGIPFPPTFAFDAESWLKCLGTPMTLKHVFRQRDQGKHDVGRTVIHVSLDISQLLSICLMT